LRLRVSVPRRKETRKWRGMAAGGLSGVGGGGSSESESKSESESESEKGYIGYLYAFKLPESSATAATTR
jgi:hypothetical protein